MLIAQGHLNLLWRARQVLVLAQSRTRWVFQGEVVNDDGVALLYHQLLSSIELTAATKVFQGDADRGPRK